MKLSELRKALPGVDAQNGEYLVVLVDLDRVPDDEVDVVLSPLRDLEVDADLNELRLYSAAQRPDSDRVPPPSIYQAFVDSLPLAGVYETDLVVKAQSPIAPGDTPAQPQELLPLGAVWVSRESGEIWLLVRDPAEYPPDLLEP